MMPPAHKQEDRCCSMRLPLATGSPRPAFLARARAAPGRPVPVHAGLCADSVGPELLRTQTLHLLVFRPPLHAPASPGPGRESCVPTARCPLLAGPAPAPVGYALLLPRDHSIHAGG